MSKNFIILPITFLERLVKVNFIMKKIKILILERVLKLGKLSLSIFVLSLIFLLYLYYIKRTSATAQFIKRTDRKFVTVQKSQRIEKQFFSRTKYFFESNCSLCSFWAYGTVKSLNNSSCFLDSVRFSDIGYIPI